MFVKIKSTLLQKAASFSALFTIGSFILSPAHSGRYDDVDVIPLNQASYCHQCVPCPAAEPIGDCGEKFVIKLLKENGFKAYSAQHNASNNGIDVVAFKELKIEGRKTPFILFHESKMSESSDISPSHFKARLGDTLTGRQQSLTWLNNAIEKMKTSKKKGVPKLGFDIENALNGGAYFARTGNLRVDYGKTSSIQFYALTDKNSRKSLEKNTAFINGPFLSKWANQHGKGFTPSNQEIPLTSNNISYLNTIFQ